MSNFAQTINPENAPVIEWGADFTAPPEIEAVKDRFNHPDFVRPDVKVVRDEFTGIETAYHSRFGDSKETAVLHFCPFSCGVSSENMLLRGAFIHDALKETGIRDQYGDTVPIISMSAPSRSSSVKQGLYGKGWEELRNGNFGFLAGLYSEVALKQYSSVGKLSLIGFSFGGSMAIERGAGKNADVTHVVAADPVNSHRRRFGRLTMLNEFGPEAKHLPSALRDAGVDPFIDAHEDDSTWDFIRNVFGRGAYSINMAISQGMSKNTLWDALLDNVLYSDRIITIGSGTRSGVAPAEAVGRIVARVEGDGVQFVSVDGSHAWGDRIDQLATFYAYGLGRES